MGIQGIHGQLSVDGQVEVQWNSMGCLCDGSPAGGLCQCCWKGDVFESSAVVGCLGGPRGGQAHRGAPVPTSTFITQAAYSARSGLQCQERCLI